MIETSKWVRSKDEKNSAASFSDTAKRDQLKHYFYCRVEADFIMAKGRTIGRNYNMQAKRKGKCNSHRKYVKDYAGC